MRLPALQIAEMTSAIHALLLSRSQFVKSPNFERVDAQDLEWLFKEYDTRFFHGGIQQSLGKMPLTFGLSKRMTSTGGMTKRYRDRISKETRFELSVSTTILFNCFRDEPHRPIVACGIECRDRLDAMQRILEHEIVHLIEMLVWDNSACAKPRFQSITNRFFGHTQHKHELITPRETAHVKYGICPGKMVRFTFEGETFQGVVNRITKRATVLVEDPQGVRYTSGKKYVKFYIPVSQLTLIE